MESENGKLQLCDESYKKDFVEQLSILQKQGLYTDATLNIEGYQIYCHKVVLCAASPYFNNIFSSGIFCLNQSY